LHNAATLSSESFLTSKPILLDSSIDKWHFNVFSADSCLVNAFPPPNFSAYQVTDRHSYSFSPIGIKPFIHKLIQSFDVCFWKV
jgi:hypothetical protein